MNELSNTKNKTVTSRLIDEIKIGNIQNREGINNFILMHANNWWDTHKAEIVGMSVQELVVLLKSVEDKDKLMEKYDAIVKSMTWEEKIKFLKLNKEGLRRANNRKFKEIALIVSLLELSAKIGIALLMAV